MFIHAQYHDQHTRKMKTITIKIYRPETKYDVRNYSDKAGRRLIDSDHPEERAEVQASEDLDDWFFERHYQAALANVRNATKYCLATFVDSDRKGDDSMPDTLPTSYSVKFRLPSDMKADFEQSLATYIHTYISYYGLAEWFKMTAPGEVDTCLTTAQQALASMVEMFTNVAPRKRWFHEA